MCVCLRAVEHEAFCLPNLHQKGAPVPSPKLLPFFALLPNLISTLMPRVPITSLSNQSHSTPLPFSPSPPPHRLAGACHRGPVGSQGPVGSKQTAFSKNCQRVVGCSQAHPPGTCSHDIAIFMHLPMWTQVNISIHPGKHPPAHVYVHMHTYTHQA